MKRILKKTILLFLALAAFACAGIAVSCGGEKTVPVTLLCEGQAAEVVEAKPGDSLPVLSVEDKDFEGYWTDAAYTQSYTGTTVPEGGITLYYKLHAQYYTVVFDFGDAGTLSYEFCRGEDEVLPSVSPVGIEVSGYTDTKGGTAIYLAGDSVRNLAQKGQTVTLYACGEITDVEDYVIENGTVTEYKGNSTALVLPLGATRVAAGAFLQNAASKNILSVTIPGTYTEIECGALEGLSSLTSLTTPFIGQSRTSNRFLSYLFGAEKYTDNTYSFSAYTDGSNFTIGDTNFENLVIPQTLRTVRVTESVKDIAEGAFYSAYSLENLVLDHPEDLKKIGNSAFENCFSFGYDTLLGVPVCPDWLAYVSEIGDRAFKSYTGNTESDVKSVTSNGVTCDLITYAYPLNSLTRIPELTNAVTIGDEAFYYCAMLEGISFGKELKSVGESSFVFALSFGVLRFPDSLEKVGDFAFQGAGVTGIEFGTGIREIGVMAFVECANLEMISFRGDKVPVLTGKQCFSNSLTESVTENWNVVLNDGFGIYVPESAADSFRTAPDWVEYAAYVNPAAEVSAPVYWSATGEGWDAKFEFTGGDVVFVTDPAKAFISTVDTATSSMTYGNTCGTFYAMMCEELSAEEAAAVAGTPSVSLYGNQKVLHLWHPDLLGADGKPLQTLYLVVTELPYAAENGRVLVPVAKIASGEEITVGNASQAGSYVISYNKLGLAEVREAGGETLAAPAGTYYTDIAKADSLRYTVTYYNQNFEVLGVRTFVLDASSAETDVPLYEQKDGYTVLKTDPAYNGGINLFLKGDGTAVIGYSVGNEKYEYTAAVTEKSSAEYGDEGYEVSFADFKANGGAVSELTGRAVFSGFDGTAYSRIDLTVGDFSYMIVNVQDEEAWQISQYSNLSSIKVKIPQYSTGLINSWRYKKLSETEISATVEIYGKGNSVYYRELDADGRVVSWGTVEYGQDGAFTLVAETSVTYSADGAPSYAASEARRDAVLSDERGSFEMDGMEFTFYNPKEDLTLIYAEEVVTGMSKYYNTVKTDGYGNIYILDESGSRAVMYLGTYTSKDILDLGAEYRQFTFVGKQVDSYGRPIASAKEEVLWVIYDESGLKVWSEEASDARWSASLIGIFTEEEDIQITVKDSFGYKLYDLTVTAYGSVKYVQYAYTLDRDGTAKYTALEQGDVNLFMPVFAEDGSVSYLVAIDYYGRIMFSVRSDGAEGYVIVRDGGQSVAAGSVAPITADPGELESLAQGGAVFGDLL